MDDNYLIWFDVETSGLDPMSDNLLEVEARITDMKGLQVPFADDHLIFHRVIRFDDNTPIRAFNSTTIDMHSRNGLISECMNAKDTLKNVDKQMAVWLIDTGLDPGLMHPAGTNVHFDIRWLDVNMPNTSGISATGGSTLPVSDSWNWLKAATHTIADTKPRIAQPTA